MSHIVEYDKIFNFFKDENDENIDNILNINKISFSPTQAFIISDDGVYVYKNCPYKNNTKKNDFEKLDFFDDKIVKKIFCSKNCIIVVCHDGIYVLKWDHTRRIQLDKNNIEKLFDGKEIHKVSCGYSHNIVVCSDGVYGWGLNDEGQLGKGDWNSAPIHAPVKLDFFDGKIVRKIYGGYHHTVAICNDGVYAWGVNTFGQVGNGDTENALSPVKLDFFDGKDIRKISCGGWHSIAVCNDGVYAWGMNVTGQLGNGNNEDSLTPTKLDFFDGKDVLSISSGESHTIAVCNDGVYAWGKNEYGQLCLDHRNDVFYPEKIEGIDFKVEKVFCGYHHTFLKKANIMVKAVVAPVMRRD